MFQFLIIFLICLPSIFARCSFTQEKKDEIDEEILPNLYVSSSLLVILNLLIFYIFVYLGYLIAGYHFYEQIVHDEIDDKELKEREERIRRIMEEQDLAWQMKKAKEERKRKKDAEICAAMAALSKPPKMITFEEHEKKLNERKLSEKKLEERVKESEKRVQELEEKLRKYQSKEKRKIQQIQVKKSDIKLLEGQKLLSGAVKPITPKKGQAEPVEVEMKTVETKSLPTKNVFIPRKPLPSPPPLMKQPKKNQQQKIAIAEKLPQQEQPSAPKMSSTEEKQQSEGAAAGGNGTTNEKVTNVSIEPPPPPPQHQQQKEKSKTVKDKKPSGTKSSHDSENSGDEKE